MINAGENQFVNSNEIIEVETGTPVATVSGFDAQTEFGGEFNSQADTAISNGDVSVLDDEEAETEPEETMPGTTPETEIPEEYQPVEIPEEDIEASGGQGIIEQPEEGAKFQIYLTSAGSYENAREAERDILITDADGFAIAKDLPYGRYTVHQVEGKEGQAFVKDFTVFIRSEDETYSYITTRPSPALSGWRSMILRLEGLSLPPTLGSRCATWPLAS